MNEQESGFVFTPENCIQCHACETACKAWRQLEPGIRWRRVENIWHGDYPAITCSTLSISCMHCVNPACIESCPTGAIAKRQSDGLVLVDQDLCIGCQACLPACPYHVPQFGTDGKMQKCDMCIGKSADGNKFQSAPPCARTCPTQALALRKVSTDEKSAQEKLLKVSR